MNLLPSGARITGGTVRLNGSDIPTVPVSEQRVLRGSAMAIAFQDPKTACNPVLTIGRQLVDFLGAQDPTRGSPGQPRLDRPEACLRPGGFCIVTNDQAAQLAYEADGFDFIRVAVGAAEQLKVALPTGAALIEAAPSRYAWLTINMNADPLRDLRVREAIQYAYDGRAVLDGAYGGLVRRGTGVVPPASGDARPTNLIAGRDLDRARALLAEGLALDLYCQTDGTCQTIAQIIPASLVEAGIVTNILPVDDASYWVPGDKTAGEGHRSVELPPMTFAGGINPTENLVWLRPDQIGVCNWSFFDSAEYENLSQASMTEQDPEKRRSMFHRMEDLIEEPGGFVFICFEPDLARHDADLVPVILADGHPDPVAFQRA